MPSDERIEIGALVSGISQVDGETERRGVVSAFFDEGLIRVENHNFSTLCRNCKSVPLSSFDPYQKSWLTERRKELLKPKEEAGQNGQTPNSPGKR